MKTIQLKTNIMCGSCVAKATPVLNEEVGATNWNVDTQHPQKVLTVTSEKFSEDDVIRILEKAGFKAASLS